MRKIIFALLVLVSQQSFAQSEWIREDYITGFLSSGYFAVRTFPQSNAPSTFFTKNQLDSSIHKRLEDAFNDKSTNLAVLLIDKGMIVFEKYKDGLDAKNPFFSFSMSKSLTAYTLGYALCSGKIKSLDDRAGDYASEIRDSVFGKATVRELLMMSSGAPPPDQETGSKNNEWNNVTRGFWSSAQILNSYGSEIYQNKNFLYNNSNTNALMLVLDGLGNFGDLFESKIWQAAKPEAPSTWLKDKDDHLYAAAGFGARLRDWGRLAMQSIKMLKGQEGQCIANYMKAATSIQTQDLRNQKFYKYGYQTWINPYRNQYAWLGAYGQSALIDPDNEKIMIVFRNEFTPESSRRFGMIFNDWTSQINTSY